MAFLPAFPLPSLHHRHVAPQRGTGMIEFLLIAVPLLLTALGGIEISHWMFTRQAVNMALTDAGRAGSTLHANPQAIIQAFEQALEPLYPATASATSAQRLQAATARNLSHHQQLPWHIQMLSPTPDHFRDFISTDPAVRHPSGLPTINNSYQLEQHDAHKQQGRTNGNGHHSGQSIFEANTLALRLTWRYTPLLPGFERIAGGLLVLKQDMTLTMQSHPVFWPDDPAGRVTRSADRVPPRPATDTTPPHTDLYDPTYQPKPNDAYLPNTVPASQPSGTNGISGEAPGNNGEGGSAVASPDQTAQGVTGTDGKPDGQAGLESQSEPQRFTGDEPGGAGGDEPVTTGDEPGVSEGSMCMNISPSFTIPSSERARSSMASLPDLRS